MKGKRRLFALPAAAALLLMSGCGSVYSNYREIEQLLVVETMGFDSIPGGVELSLSSGMGAGSSAPIRLVGRGRSVSAAMEQARNYSFEDELFCAQTNGVLIGEAAAKQGVEDYLSYICQSPILRTDVPVFIVKGASAKEGIMNTGDSRHGVAEILQGVTEYLETRGSSHIFKASELLRSQLRYGSALCCVLEYTEAGEPPAELSPNETAGSGSGEDEQGGGEDREDEGQGAKTLAVSGFGVLQDGRLSAYIDGMQALGASFLMNKVGIGTIELTDNEGEDCVLEINGGSSSIEPRWNADGSLAGLDISVKAEATVTQIGKGGDLSDEDYTEQLSEGLEQYVAERIGEVLRLSAELKADFLGLGGAVEQKAPLLFRHLDAPFDQLLPALEFRIAVSGQLGHTNDMKESFA